MNAVVDRWPYIRATIFIFTFNFLLALLLCHTSINFLLLHDEAAIIPCWGTAKDYQAKAHRSMSTILPLRVLKFSCDCIASISCMLHTSLCIIYCLQKRCATSCRVCDSSERLACNTTYERQRRQCSYHSERAHTMTCYSNSVFVSKRCLRQKTRVNTGTLPS